MLPSETMIWQPEFTDKTLSRKTGAVHIVNNKLRKIIFCFRFLIGLLCS
ncbi:PapI protein [Escherichia coli]|nr:PapI protein [Escherichia coli]